MKINKKDLDIKFSYCEIPENIKTDQLEKIKNNEKENTKYINEIWNEIVYMYERSNDYNEFENSFFFYWYISIEVRGLIIPLIVSLFKHYEINMPKFFYNDMKLYENSEIEVNQQINVNDDNLDNKNKEKGELKDVYIIGESKIEIYSDKSEDLKQQLDDELKFKKEKEEFEKISKVAECFLSESNSYKDYILKLKPIYYKLYEIYTNSRTFEFYRGYISFGLAHQRKEWKNDIPDVPMLSFVSAKPIPYDIAKMYQREEELLEIYKDEGYIYKTLIFNHDYSIKNREEFISSLINIFKQKPDLSNFISSSVEKQVQGFLKSQDEMVKALNNYKGERVLVYEDLIKEIENSNFYKNLSEKQKLDLKEIYTKLVDSDLRFKFYYKDYQNIKSEIDNKKYINNERDKANKIGIDDFTGWKYAFYVLVFRNEGNIHFMNCFKDNDYNRIDINDQVNIEHWFDKFHNAYNVDSYRKSKQK